jgi:nucleotide-binding universal stress UspA family protein
MSIKDILLQVDNRKSFDARMKYAASLAREFGAHITGLYLMSNWTVPAYVEGQIPVDVLEQQAKRAGLAAIEAEQQFESHVKSQGLLAEWRVAEGNPLDQLVLNARYVDLVIVGQPEKDVPEILELTYADSVALESGRPVLVVPSIGVGRFEIDRVLIAWNGSRESVRAVNDALPLLQRAKEVFVLAVNLPKELQDSDVPGADISLHLSRHGVNAQAESISGADISVGDVLLSRCADKSADLIVMGAYGHSRFRELVLGGATHYLLDHMTVPVLFSH